MRATPDFDFGLGEEAAMIRETVARFADEVIAPRAEAIDRRTQAPRARAVEVRNLNNPHTLNQNRHACSVNNATSTGRRTNHEHAPQPTHPTHRERACLHKDTPVQADILRTLVRRSACAFVRRG